MKAGTTEGDNSLWDYYRSERRTTPKAVISDGGEGRRKGDRSERRTIIEAAIFKGGDAFGNFVNALNIVFSVSYKLRLILAE